VAARTLETEERLFTTGEVAALFRVEPKTVTRWAKCNPPKLRSVRTLGGHRRFYESEVRELLTERGLPGLPEQQ
jgi:excisionase family DNA binding protein